MNGLKYAKSLVWFFKIKVCGLEQSFSAHAFVILVSLLDSAGFKRLKEEFNHLFTVIHPSEHHALMLKSSSIIRYILLTILLCIYLV